jgi:hypothetical protein
MSKAQIIEAIQKCARELGRKPSMDEFREATGLSSRQLMNAFDTWAAALESSGFSPIGAGHAIPMRDLFEDWARVVRQTQRIPTAAEYRRRRGRFSVKVFRRRFALWANVATAMRDFAEKEGLEGEWKDVVAVVDADLGRKERGEREAQTLSLPGKKGIIEGRPVYGPPMATMPLLYEPNNEAGVLFLFGVMATELGFQVMRMQAGFPDCEALCEMAPGKWQRVRVELEFESRNFLDHGHSVAGCDMIVCWRHNWAECPLRVVELRNRAKSPESP